MNWKEEFIYFLKYNGWLNAFVDNLDLRCPADGDILDLVSDAFPWDETDEGVDFWYIISTDWKRYVYYWENEVI